MVVVDTVWKTKGLRLEERGLQSLHLCLILSFAFTQAHCYSHIFYFHLAITETTESGLNVGLARVYGVCKSAFNVQEVLFQYLFLLHAMRPQTCGFSRKFSCFAEVGGHH